MNEMQKLADELEAYASQYSSDWVVANPTISWTRLNLIVAALRAQAQQFPCIECDNETSCLNRASCYYRAQAQGEPVAQSPEFLAWCEAAAREIDGTAFRPAHMGDDLSETDKEMWLRRRNAALYKAGRIRALPASGEADPGPLHDSRNPNHGRTGGLRDAPHR